MSNETTPIETTPEGTLRCEFCGGLGIPWGKPSTLEGCCPFIRLMDGKVSILYFGFIHQGCGQPHWKKEIDQAVERGWLVPSDQGEGTYEPAPQFRAPR